jgi:hypothetical protein
MDTIDIALSPYCPISCTKSVLMARGNEPPEGLPSGLTMDEKSLRRHAINQMVSVSRLNFRTLQKSGRQRNDLIAVET